MTKHKLHYVCAAVLLKTDKIIMDNVCIVCVVACSMDDVNDDSTRCIRKTPVSGSAVHTAILETYPYL